MQSKEDLATRQKLIIYPPELVARFDNPKRTCKHLPTPITVLVVFRTVAMTWNYLSNTNIRAFIFFNSSKLP